MNRLQWRATYADGTTLTEGNGIGYGDIDRDKLMSFSLYRGDVPLVVVDMEDDRKPEEAEVGPKRLVWRMRHRVNARGGEEVIHLVGWQRTVNGRNVQAICYVTEGGTVVLGGQWRDDHPVMVQPKRQPGE